MRRGGALSAGVVIRDVAIFRSLVYAAIERGELAAAIPSGQGFPETGAKAVGGGQKAQPRTRISAHICLVMSARTGNRGRAKKLPVSPVRQ